MTATPTLVPDPSPPVAVRGIALNVWRDRYTQAGTVRFRAANIPVSSDWEFQKTWRTDKRRWLERGYSLRNANGRWLLEQWLRQTEEGLALTAEGERRLEGLVKASSLLAEPERQAVQITLPEFPPHLAGKLFDYQVDPARQIFRALTVGNSEWGYPGAWDCSDMGVGKTFQSLAAALASGKEVGVICPLAVIPAWKGAFQHFGACPRFVVNYESLRTGNRDWVDRVNYRDGKGRERKRFEWRLDPAHTVLIWDEAHNCKTTGSLNQGMLMAAIRRRFPLILCSGTLATDPTNMRGTGRVVGLHKGGDDFFQFLHRHNCTRVGDVWDWKFSGGRRGRAALAEIHHTVFPRRGARTRIAELGDRFPETQIMAEPFETGETAAIAKAFKEADERLEKLRNAGMSEAAVEARRQTEYLRAWHDSERAKVPTIAAMVQSEQAEGRSVAVFVNFTDVREALMARLKTQCAIYGGQKPEDRQSRIADFQADKSRVIIANIAAGGVGVSLHDVRGEHPRTAIILPTNKVVDLTQALGRVHRAGGRSRSRQIVLFAAGTVEEDICQAVRTRMNQIATLNDGDLNPTPKF